ncbi:MAG: ThiF family adenylyltransferase [Burkholderiales bacterium]|nr:ThiF family adenylyltransferase [Burkholderiales bacterium]
MERALPVVGANQRRVNVQIADVPIVKPLTPDTWPRTSRDLERLVRLRLPDAVAERFLNGRGKGNRPIHRLVILRAPECSFGFLLPGGPVSPVRCGHSWKVQRVRQPLPLPVDRLDVAWICGRDQHSEIATRQQQRVLVVGVGALGSFVVEHLVKAGVGHLTLVDSDSLSAANLGRHALGANDLGRNKVEALASRVMEAWPAASIMPVPLTLDSWLKRHSLADFDLILDLTGEPNVRLHLEQARQRTPCPLLVGWMEPFAAAAHVCLLPAGQPWSQALRDPLDTCMAINWPTDVMLREPGCSSQFQSYTHAAASYAVAMVSEAALGLLDGEVPAPLLRSLVRGRRFLEKVRQGLSYREWSANAADRDLTIWDRPWHA